MYLDKFQMRRVRGIVPMPASPDRVHLDKLKQFKQAKQIQFNRVVAVAQWLLPLKSSLAFECIYREYMKYVALAKQEHRYLSRTKKLTLYHYLYANRNVRDVWWALSPHVRELWDQVTELRKWKEKFR